jgi:predicted PurR-regulated permease PerM
VLWWARAVFIPVLLALLISHALEPLVGWLERHHCPRPIGAFLAVAGLLSGLAAAAYALRDPAAIFATQLPASVHKLRVAAEAHLRERDGAINRVQQVASDLERAAGAADRSTPSGVTRVRVDEPPFRLGDLAWRGSRELAILLTQAVMVVFLLYYLLLAGDMFRRKLATIAGPSFGRKRQVLRVLIDIDRHIQRFLLARLFISVIVATATYLALSMLRVHQPGMWGLVSGGLNVVPYIGPVVAVAGVTLAAFAQFGTLPEVLAAGGSAALVAAIEGYLITPRLTGRAGGMNAVAIFIGILFWGWLWGVMGMRLAVPLLTAIKSYAPVSTACSPWRSYSATESGLGTRVHSSREPRVPEPRVSSECLPRGRAEERP